MKFAQPILDLISEHTGWAVTLIAGGPEPADCGHLNMLRYDFIDRLHDPIIDDILYYSLHAGTTSGVVKMNFGRAERAAYRDYILPIFGRFLRKCYCESSILHVQLMLDHILIFFSCSVQPLTSAASMHYQRSTDLLACLEWTHRKVSRYLHSTTACVRKGLPISKKVDRRVTRLPPYRALIQVPLRKPSQLLQRSPFRSR